MLYKLSKKLIKMKYIVKCKKCKTILTKPLTNLTVNEFIEFEKHNYDRKNFVQEGFLYQAHKDLSSLCKIPQNNVVINLKDMQNYLYYNDSIRLLGCCGINGNNGINIKCLNNHEVATESSDCIGLHLIHFEFRNIYLYSINQDLYDLLEFIESKVNDNNIISIKELIQNELEKDAFELIIEILYFNQIKVDKNIFDLIINIKEKLNLNDFEFSMLE